MARKKTEEAPAEPQGSLTEAETKTQETEQPPADAERADTQAAELLPVEEQLAGLPAWERAALQAQYKWPLGTRLTAKAFAEARKTMKGTVLK